jgi:hypothetical protein
MMDARRRKMTILMAISGGGAPQGSLLVPGRLFPPMVLTRAQASGAMSTGIASNGVRRDAYSADVPRFNETAQRLLLEGARTNLIRNPWGEGLVIGAPGTLPTNWSSSTTAGGITRSVVGYETINGVSCVLIRFAGTSTSGAFVVLFEPAAQIAATVGQVYALSAVMRITNAGTPPAEMRMLLREVPSNTDYSYVVVPGASNLSRVTAMHTVTDAANTSIRPGFSLAHTSGQAIETTIAVSFAQCELAAFASSPILPAVGTPAASTRGADLVSATLASLGVGASGACTVIGTAMLPQAAPSGASQIVLHIDNGSDTNRIMVRNSPGSANIVLTRTAAGVGADSLSQAITPGTPFRWGITVDGAGNALLSVDGAAPLTVTGAPTSGLTTLRVGSNSGGSANMFGEVAGLRVLPFVVSAAELQRLVAEQAL